VDWSRECGELIVDLCPQGQLDIKGKTDQMIPLKLKPEPELRAVIEQIADQLGQQIDPRSL
jgi:hypothetical protein